MNTEIKTMMSPEACSAWLKENKPEFALPGITLRRLALQVGSGLRATILPVAGTVRRRSVRVRPIDVVHFFARM